MRDDFAAFVLTHGRPDNVLTVDTLRRRGYTGRVYLVIDDEDPTGPQYRERYGDDMVLTFSKEAVARTVDLYDNSRDWRTVAFARNACWDLARQVGVRYFIQLDDDYFNFMYRRTGATAAHPVAGRKNPDPDTVGYHGWSIRDLDRILTAMVEFMETTPAHTICMSQGGDHIGGADNRNFDTRLLRKAMNSFVLDVERPFPFPGRINEDVNAYVGHGARGLLLFTHTDLQLVQLVTQSNDGGMSAMYRESGTYAKSFFTIVANPSCVQVRRMGNINMRMHHHVTWRYAVPKILHERHRKP